MRRILRDRCWLGRPRPKTARLFISPEAESLLKNRLRPTLTRLPSTVPTTAARLTPTRPRLHRDLCETAPPRKPPHPPAAALRTTRTSFPNQMLRPVRLPPGR